MEHIGPHISTECGDFLGREGHSGGQISSVEGWKHFVEKVETQRPKLETKKPKNKKQANI